MEVRVDKSSYGSHTLNSIVDSAVEVVHVVQEYPDVFPEELPEMSPDRDLEFIIELIPRTALISKRPYRMPANELEELKR